MLALESGSLAAYNNDSETIESIIIIMHSILAECVAS
jgi:hypothetical protein